jgi:serine/threonine protein kinase
VTAVNPSRQRTCVSAPYRRAYADPHLLAHRFQAVDTAEMSGDPSQIGPYKVLSLLGEGGMGAVYAAEQRQPFERRVAVKVIKIGMDTKDVLARFDVERKALALLDHPHIARILDAGSTSDGRPYFAMELVRGQPITRYCDSNRLNLAQRVALLKQACNAIQHAHDRGILHRDIKPSNILVSEVDGAAYVKVIDFGLAKAVNQRLTDRTLFTEEGRIIGTVEYMSPEQADLTNQDIDHRTDVYSLGAVLYELVAGVLPFDPSRLRSQGLAEMQRAICEIDPPTPSKRLVEMKDSIAAIAELRQCALRELRGALRRGLDAVVMRAMAKRRADRYATCRDLAADLERFLIGGTIRLGFGWRSRMLGRKAIRATTSRTGIAVSVAALAGFAAWAISGYGAVERYEDLLRDRDTVIRNLNGKLAHLEGQIPDEKAAWMQAAENTPETPAFASSSQAPAFVTRSAWGGLEVTEPVLSQRDWTKGEAVIVLSESRADNVGSPQMLAFQEEARASNETDIPFHFFIDRNGLALEGRNLQWPCGGPFSTDAGQAIVILVDAGAQRDLLVEFLSPLLKSIGARGLIASKNVRFLRIGKDLVIQNDEAQHELGSSPRSLSLSRWISELRSQLSPYDADHGAAVEATRLLDLGPDRMYRWQWTDKPEIRTRMDPMGACRRITLHHSAILHRSNDLEASIHAIQAVQRLHIQQNGLGDIGYHFVIDTSGRIFEGRSLQFQGAHAKGENNKNNVGVCLLGNFTRGDGGQAPTAAQMASTQELLDALRNRYGISRDQCMAHSDFVSTECPGPYLIEWLQQYRRGDTAKTSEQKR